MRTQPPGFRWLVGGFALVAAVAFGFRYLSAHDPVDLLFGALCLVAAGYWLIVDREPAPEDPAGGGSNGRNRAGDRNGAGALGRGEETAPDPGRDVSW
ncbi:MAG TPA: hypothetical protein VF714_02585 [Jatrophihabitans sp.]